jgi:AraC-like DNA-binding protein
MEDRDARGVLYPARLPTFHRLPPPPELEGLVRWFWIPTWHLAPGRTSRQELLPFPACNLTVEPSGVGLTGPSTRRTHRDLTGDGWAVGALLRPAAVPSLGIDPRAIRDSEVAYDGPELHRQVAGAMATSDETRRERAVAAYSTWLLERLDPVDVEGGLANAMEDLVAADRSITRVDQLASGLGISARAVQRLARSHVGVPPLAMIRRYRLQEAAQRLRTEDVGVGQVAAELGYADQAHLCADFRTVLGFNPTAYHSELAQRPD